MSDIPSAAPSNHPVKSAGKSGHKAGKPSAKDPSEQAASFVELLSAQIDRVQDGAMDKPLPVDPAAAPRKGRARKESGDTSASETVRRDIDQIDDAALAAALPEPPAAPQLAQRIVEAMRSSRTTDTASAGGLAAKVDAKAAMKPATDAAYNGPDVSSPPSLPNPRPNAGAGFAGPAAAIMHDAYPRAAEPRTEPIVAPASNRVSIESDAVAAPAASATGAAASVPAVAPAAASSTARRADGNAAGPDAATTIVRTPADAAAIAAAADSSKAARPGDAAQLAVAAAAGEAIPRPPKQRATSGAATSVEAAGPRAASREPAGTAALTNAPVQAKNDALPVEPRNQRAATEALNARLASDAATREPTVRASAGASQEGALGAMPHAEFAAMLAPATGIQASGPAELRVAAPIGRPQWAGELAGVVEVAIRNGIEEASIRITPSELGPIELRVRLDGDAASVEFTASHGDTRAAIEAALPRLRESLEAGGLRLADANVSTGAGAAVGNAFAGENTGSGRDAQSGGGSNPRSGRDATPEDAAAAAAPGPLSRAPTLADRIVDTFA